MVEINTKEDKGIQEVVVKGQVDASSSIHLDNALDNVFSKSGKVLIDLSGLTYISSAGLGVFIAKLDEIEKNKWKMVLFGLNEKVAEVFNILGLGELLTIKPTRAEAMECMA